MRKLLFLVCVMSAVLSSCTHNNGDIGPLFGTWRLDAISIDTTGDDGAPACRTEDVGDVFWAFQNHVVEIERVYPYHQTDTRVGTWQRPDDASIVINFDNSETDPAFAERYIMLPGIYLPEHGAVMSVKKLDRNKMTLVYIDNAGVGETPAVAYTYYFTKW